MNILGPVIEFRVSEALGTATKIAAGAQTGKAHARLLLKRIGAAKIPESGLIILVSFRGIELATASYVKETILWLAICGRMHAGALSPSEQRSLDWSSLQPLNVFPAVSDANEDIQHEIDEVFARRGLPCVLVEEVNNDLILVAKILGSVEPTLARTIQAIEGSSDATADDLHRKCPDEGVNITAWNNRLSELNRMRIARRRRDGKFWRYQPLAGVMKYG